MNRAPRTWGGPLNEGAGRLVRWRGNTGSQPRTYWETSAFQVHPTEHRWHPQTFHSSHPYGAPGMSSFLSNKSSLMVMDNRRWPGPSRAGTPSIIDTPWTHTNHHASSLVEDGASPAEGLGAWGGSPSSGDGNHLCSSTDGAKRQEMKYRGLQGGD